MTIYRSPYRKANAGNMVRHSLHVPSIGVIYIDNGIHCVVKGMQQVHGCFKTAIPNNECFKCRCFASIHFTYGEHYNILGLSIYWSTSPVLDQQAKCWKTRLEMAIFQQVYLIFCVHSFVLFGDVIQTGMALLWLQIIKLFNDTTAVEAWFRCLKWIYI